MMYKMQNLDPHVLCNPEHLQYNVLYCSQSTLIQNLFVIDNMIIRNYLIMTQLFYDI